MNNNYYKEIGMYQSDYKIIFTKLMKLNIIKIYIKMFNVDIYIICYNILNSLLVIIKIIL